MVDENGVPKGLKQVLMEREYDVTGMKKEQLQELLSGEIDFLDDSKNTKLSLLIDELTHGHGICKFNVKFHPELAYSIETLWALGKQKYRAYRGYRRQESAVETIARIIWCFDEIKLDTIRKLFIKQREYEDAYRGGAVAANITAEVKELKKKRTRHR